VSFVGLAGGLEERATARRGLPFHSLVAAPVVGVTLTAKLGALARNARSALAGRRLVRSEGIDAVVGLGGFVSVPGVLGGWLARRPILLFEPNATVGVANRWLSRFAAEAALAHADATAPMRCPVAVTGTPVRAEFFEQPDYVPAAATRGLQLLDASISPPFDLVDQPGLLRLRWQIADIAAWWAMRAAANDPAVPAFWASIEPLIQSRERRYWVADSLSGGARAAEASWPEPLPTTAFEFPTRGWRETAQLHLGGGATRAAMEILSGVLAEAGRALPGIQGAWIAANHVADYGAGHFTWDLLFEDRDAARAARQSVPWRERIAPALGSCSVSAAGATAPFSRAVSFLPVLGLCLLALRRRRR
jgi:MYXO-CTERM domain-containing protein